MLDQLAQQQPALGHRPVDDPRGVRGEVERPPVRARDRAHQRVDRALERVLLVLRELEAEGLARVGDRVVHAQALEPRLRLVGQRVVGRAHVGELGVRVDGRDDLGREHRVAAGRVLERGVGVPQAVAEAVHAPAVVRLA